MESPETKWTFSAWRFWIARDGPSGLQQTEEATGKTMITGAHTIIYSADPAADRSFFRDVLALPNIDLGGGWLLFALPPSEVAVPPSEKNDCP